MQPQSHRTRARSAAVARGRMFLKARLDWLSGYPAVQRNGVVTWLRVPRQGERGPVPVLLDREVLHRATRTWSKLVHRFPRALPQIVDDYDRWVTGVPQLLEWLKPAIHEGEALPTSLFAVKDAYSRQVVAQANRLVARYPTLQPLLNALSWSGYLVPQEMSGALNWMETNVAALSVMLAQANADTEQSMGAFNAAAPHEGTSETLGDNGVVLALTLWHLARRDGEQRVAPLVTWLGDERLYALPMVRVDSYLGNWNNCIQQARKFGNTSTFPESLPLPAAGQLRAFVLALATTHQRVRRRTFDLLPLFAMDERFGTWAAWWEMVEPLLGRARRTIALAQAQTHKHDHQPYVAQLDELAQQLQESIDLMPSPLAWDELLADVQAVTVDEQQPFFAELLPIVALLPRTIADVPLRPLFLYHWGKLAREYPTAAAPYLRALRGYLTMHGLTGSNVERQLSPWSELWHRERHLRRWGCWSIDHTILDELPERRHWPYVFAALASVRGSHLGELTADHAEWVVALTKLLVSTTTTEDLRLLSQPRHVPTPSPAEVAEMVSHYFYAFSQTPVLTMNADTDFLASLLALHGGLTTEDPGWPDVKTGPDAMLIALTAQLYKIWRSDDQLLAPIQQLAAALQPTPWAALPAILLIDGDVATLPIVPIVGQQLRLLRALGGTVPPLERQSVDALPAWATRFPTPFHGLLRQLASIDPDAAATTDRLLGQSWPGPANLHQEIASIEALLPTHPHPDHLQQRLANLRQRLAAPAPVSAGRIEKLLTKLARTVRRVVLQAWQARIEAAVRHELSALLTVDPLPDWLLQPRQLQILVPLFVLSPAFRKLGIRLLQQRVGEPPWHLHADPANQQYVARMVRQGINILPWIGPELPQPYIGENGRQVWVGIEEDPLEIFHMGGHFRTCLSPGDFNFFSVFANAADVNKQVVFARDEKGQVVGRCLLALTDGGQLLTFEPYCHDPALNFGDIMAQFVTTLTAAMNTTLAYRGPVSTLVAPDWYDDGPRDLCGRFAFLAHGSAFREQLDTITPEAFLAALLEGFAPLGLNTLTLPHVLDLQAVTQRAELVRVLLPYVGEGKGFSDEMLLHLASLVYRTSEEETADEFVMRIVHRCARRYYLTQWVNRHRGHDSHHFDLPHYFDLLVAVDPSLALRILRQTRPIGVSRDEEETNYWRLHYLCRAHEALGRPVRVARLREKADAILKQRG